MGTCSRHVYQSRPVKPSSRAELAHAGSPGPRRLAGRPTPARSRPTPARRQAHAGSPGPRRLAGPTPARRLAAGPRRLAGPTPARRQAHAGSPGPRRLAGPTPARRAHAGSPGPRRRSHPTGGREGYHLILYIILQEVMTLLFINIPMCQLLQICMVLMKKDLVLIIQNLFLDTLDTGSAYTPPGVIVNQ